MRSLRALLCSVLAAGTLVAAPACQSNPADVVGGGLEDVVGSIEDWVGGADLPGEHMSALRGVHEPGTWRLRTDVDGALETAREAVRGLGQTDLSTWRDAGVVIQILSSIATDHSASLVRVEALDSLARVAPWTLQAEQAPVFEAGEGAVIDALKVVREAQGQDDAEPAFTAEVLNAVRVLANYRFDADSSPDIEAPLGRAARRHGGNLRNARGVLLAFTGSTLEGFRGDPEIRDEMDRAYVALGASVIRTTFTTALTGDDNATVRANAARQVGDLQLEGAAVELGRSLRDDLSSSVRRASASALSAYPVDVAFPLLVEGLYDDMPDVRGATARALAALTGETFGEDRQAWRRWWQARSGGDAAATTDSGAR